MVIPASVKSLRQFQTRTGARLYVVFETADGRTLGVWVPADDGSVSHLRLGDRVRLQQDRHQRLHFSPRQRR